MHDDAHMITIAELYDAKARIEELEAQAVVKEMFYKNRLEELEAKIFHMSEQGAKNDPLINDAKLG